MKYTSPLAWYFLCLLIFSTQICAAYSCANADSVTVPASENYSSNSPVTYIFLGKNYRNLWSIPVKMPVFDIVKAPQKFKISKLGGGKQTKSLRMIDSRGDEWVLRTVDKGVEDALPKYARNNIVEMVVQDMVSAAHPYGPLVTACLAKAANIIAPDPQLYYISADAHLDSFTHYFANSVCYLERRAPTPDYSDAFSTETVFEKLLESKTRVKQKEVLRARLLDMLIGDWDRHNDQWRWGKSDSGGLVYYYPIPVDRDQAFFHANGILAGIVSSTAAPYFRGFSRHSYDLKDLSYKSWTFDRILLNELTESDWHSIITSFQQQINDDVIHESVMKLPPEIYSVNGAQMEETLKMRRNDLLKKAMRYYAFLAKDVFLMSTENKETYHISQLKDSIKLTVSGVSKKNNKIYERTFSSGELKNLYLVGKSEEDSIRIDKDVSAHVNIHTLSGDTDDLLYAKDE